jgi:hypothetical protein
MNGYKVIGPNGNYIFLPAGGHKNYDIHSEYNIKGYYWTSSNNSANDIFQADLIIRDGGRIVEGQQKWKGLNIRLIK